MKYQYAHPPQIATESIHAPKCSKILSEGITKNRQKSLWWKAAKLHIFNMAARISAAILEICKLDTFQHCDFWRFLVYNSGVHSGHTVIRMVSVAISGG